jgi:hypothetical protein
MIKMHRLQNTLYAFFVLAIVFSSLTSAQNVSAAASVDSTSVALGDWIRLMLEVKCPSTATVYFPVVKDSLGSFEIVKQDSLQRTHNDSVTVLSRIFTVASFRDGQKTIPSIPVSYRLGSDTTIRTAQTNPISIEVRAVAVDTGAALRDIKPPIAVPISAVEIALYAGSVIVSALILYFLYKYIRRRKGKSSEKVEVQPIVPPDLLAMQKLDELEAQRLWQQGEIKLFYSNATEIVREYFELRYGIMALEMTTGEVMHQLRSRIDDRPVRNSIEEYLSHADLVKFAKHRPDLKENEDTIPQARSIIDHTKPVVSAEQVQKGTGVDE